MAIVSDPVREEKVMVRFFGRAVKKAADMGIDKVMLTCEPDNISSRKVIEANKGKLHGIKDEKCNYWITL